VIHSYEGGKSLFKTAKKHWGSNKRIVLHNELVMTKENLAKYVVANIKGPPGTEWPGRGYYEKYYGGTEELIATGEIGGWFATEPPCKADIILIDGTRFTHAGIVATLLQHKNIWGRDTVWLAENDGGKEASEQEILESIWKLGGLTVEPPSPADPPSRQDHPWMVFRVDGCAREGHGDPGC